MTDVWACRWVRVILVDGWAIVYQGATVELVKFSRRHLDVNTK